MTGEEQVREARGRANRAASDDGRARRRSTSTWRTVAVIVLGLFIALLGFGLLADGVDDRIDDALATGEAPLAPDFQLDTLAPASGPEHRLSRLFERAAADGTVELSELRGTPVVLNFWASWCGPCRDEAPALETGWNLARERGVLYLGLNMQDLTEDGLEFIDELGLTYPSVRDPGREVANSYGLTGIPETYFIDRGGRVVGHAIGVVEDAILRTGVRAALDRDVIGPIRAGAQGGKG